MSSQLFTYWNFDEKWVRALQILSGEISQDSGDNQNRSIRGLVFEGVKWSPIEKPIGLKYLDHYVVARIPSPALSQVFIPIYFTI